MRTTCTRCTQPLTTAYGDDWNAGYCGACISYLQDVVAEQLANQLAHYAGYTEEEWRDYAEGRYSFSPPPVTTFNWDVESWMAYIFGPRK